jgi:hypothetical protein
MGDAYNVNMVARHTYCLTPLPLSKTMAAMQSLNLSGEEKKSDGRIKSLFWPTVENAWDVDYLGQQGFWICLIIAAISLTFIAISASEMPNPAPRVVTMILGGVVSFVYFVGGMGVRQASWPAALTVFVLYVLNQVSAGRAPSVLSLIIAGVLLSNVRATILAERWKPVSEDEDRPTRFNESFRDKLVDQLPPRAWPILKYPFFALTVIVVLMMLGNFALRARHSGQTNDENATPSVTVSPDNH